MPPSVAASKISSMVPGEAAVHPHLQERMPGFYFSMGETAEVVAK